MKKIALLILMLFVFTSIFAACTPSEYTKGVDVDESFPIELLGVYDDAVVFESEVRFNKVIIKMGTEDDLDDIVDYFNDFYDYMNISPLSENYDDDEYTAEFTAEGYDFELEVTEADGDYIEDLFSYVIEISAEESDEAEDTAVNDEETTESTDSPDPFSQYNPTPIVVPAGETPLVAPLLGAWYSEEVISQESYEVHYVDYTIYFADDSTGSYHIMDGQSQTQESYEFSYAVINSVLVLELSDGTVLFYDAYYDNEKMHLFAQDGSYEITLLNWNTESGMTPNIGKFTAYGSWISYENESSPLGITLWDGGSGYVLNWDGGEGYKEIVWTESGSTVQLTIGATDTQSFELTHMGNVIKTVSADGEASYFYRATTYAVAGVYEVSQTNDSDVTNWKATLYLDGSASHKISSGAFSFNYDDSSWYINPLDGKVYAFIFGEYAAFDYAYFDTGLILSEPDEGLEYTFSKTD